MEKKSTMCEVLRVSSAIPRLVHIQKLRNEPYCRFRTDVNGLHERYDQSGQKLDVIISLKTSRNDADSNLHIKALPHLEFPTEKCGSSGDKVLRGRELSGSRVRPILGVCV